MPDKDNSKPITAQDLKEALAEALPPVAELQYRIAELEAALAEARETRESLVALVAHLGRGGGATIPPVQSFDERTGRDTVSRRKKGA